MAFQVWIGTTVPKSPGHGFGVSGLASERYPWTHYLSLSIDMFEQRGVLFHIRVDRGLRMLPFRMQVQGIDINNVL